MIRIVMILGGFFPLMVQAGRSNSDDIQIQGYVKRFNEKEVELQLKTKTITLPRKDFPSYTELIVGCPVMANLEKEEAQKLFHWKTADNSTLPTRDSTPKELRASAPLFEQLAR